MFTTPYREKATLKPFGPVLNGRQSLMGLDYRAAMWRGDEQNPFHTEVGYWLWDPATGELLHGFVVPRGITVLAGAAGVAAGARTFELSAVLGDARYGDQPGRLPRPAGQLGRLHGHDHGRRRHLVLRPVHHAAHVRDPRGVPAHRPQPAPAGQLTRWR